ncbi:hypothetical protein JX266_013759 [Neoarthrinium moseri]|nr:hypothetical protein JX266_013759 [Neoarthrinium moseri]
MPLALQLPQKHEYDQNSVWEFSSHRQTQSTTTDPCVLEPPNTWANENVQSTSGNHFFEETLRLFYRETIHHTLTAIQALGIMSLRDATADGTRKFGITLARVRTAIEMGLHQLCDDGDEDEIATQGATFCASPSTMRCSFLATNSSDALVYRSVLGHATRRGAGLAG